ncbi:hypothetical protein ABG067_006371 [Albugo candida]
MGLTREEILELDSVHNVQDCKRILAEMFNLKDENDYHTKFLLAIYYRIYRYPYTFRFAIEQKITIEKSSVLLGISHVLVMDDFAFTSQSTLRSSIDRFQQLILAHSVNRSPTSTKIFELEDVREITDFFMHDYYRHFGLNKCVFTPYRRMYLVQRTINDVQVPRKINPLKEGLRLDPAEGL